MSAYYVKVRKRATVLQCGCTVAKFEKLRCITAAKTHAASARWLPVHCPNHKEPTGVDRYAVRDA